MLANRKHFLKCLRSSRGTFSSSASNNCVPLWQHLLFKGKVAPKCWFNKDNDTNLTV